MCHEHINWTALHKVLLTLPVFRMYIQFLYHLWEEKKSSVVKTKQKNWPDDNTDLELQQITNCTQVKITMKTKIKLFLHLLASVSSNQSLQTKSLNLKNVLQKCFPLLHPQTLLNLQLCLMFSSPLSHRITHLRGVKTLTDSDFPRSCGISTKCHDANEITRGSRTDKQWRSLKLPFPGTLYSFSIQRMNQGYCRSFCISLLIRAAVLYRGAVGERCSLDVFPTLRFTAGAAVLYLL